MFAASLTSTSMSGRRSAIDGGRSRSRRPGRYWNSPTGREAELMSLPLLLQIARNSAVQRRFSAQAPDSVARGDVVVEALAPDQEGHLQPPDVGEIVLSVPSPETLAREHDEVRQVIGRAKPGVEPLVIVVEAADDVRDEEVAAVLEAAAHTKRPIIVRILRDA